MIYFDNAATGGRKPETVYTALSSAIKVCANPGRGGHKRALACANVVQNCRNTLDEFFGGYGFDRVIFTKNCTEALNIALLGTLKRGDHVVTTCMEHNSVLRPLQFLKNTRGVAYDVCGLQGDNISADEIKKLIRPNTKLVAVTLASNVTGARPDILSIRKAIPPHVLLLCDGAQAGGHFPIDMQKSGIDLLALAGHKGLLGIQGSGALLFSERVDPQPILFGGTGSMSASLDMPDFYPDGLEAGTLSYPAVVSLLEGVRHLTVHQAEIAETVFSLTEYLIRELRTLDNYVLFSKPNVCGIVSFCHKRLQSEILADTLSSKYDIAVRGGLHCAPLMHEALSTLDGGLVRVSFAQENSIDEVDALLNALRKIG